MAAAGGESEKERAGYLLHLSNRPLAAMHISASEMAAAVRPKIKADRSTGEVFVGLVNFNEFPLGVLSLFSLNNS